MCRIATISDSQTRPNNDDSTFCSAGHTPRPAKVPLPLEGNRKVPGGGKPSLDGGVTGRQTRAPPKGKQARRPEPPPPKGKQARRPEAPPKGSRPRDWRSLLPGEAGQETRATPRPGEAGAGDRPTHPQGKSRQAAAKEHVRAGVVVAGRRVGREKREVEAEEAGRDDEREEDGAARHGHDERHRHVGRLLVL